MPTTRADRRKDRAPCARPAVPARWITLLLLAFALGACAERRAPAEAPGFAAERMSGRRAAERLAARQQASASSLSAAEVIAAGYMERLRVGLGSPFRLMEYALRDPRLAPEIRAPLAWALLDATAAGRGYAVHPAALARIGADPPSRDAALGDAHLRLIERAIRDAGDPRAGEIAVREAYRLASTSRTVSRSAPAVAASAAALVRDRELARIDAERLLAAARREGRSPFVLLVQWRAQRRFAVEAPPGAPRDPALDEAAGQQAIALAARVEALADSPSLLTARTDTLPRLGRAAARRLAALARTHAYPTQAPVWITVQRYDDELRRRAAAEGLSTRQVQRLLAHARTEEALVAENAALGSALPPRVREIRAVIATEAGVAMRAYAQERVWFPGFAAPTTPDLKRAFGLRRVEFDADVPGPWRPYYRRMLQDALADLELVVPSLDLRGATFRIGDTGRAGLALAVHDPRKRTIHLPPESGAGAIAHEVGHDLDWQVARARYHTRAAYGTEHALQSGRDDDFAAAVRRMPVPPDLPMPGGPDAQRRYAQRPPEIFARTFDGFVAAALAERGRSNGYLTAAQDEFLGGHGLALTPGARDDAAPFMEMMRVVSPVGEPVRRGFLARWGADRVPGALEMAARMTAGAPVGAAPGPAVRAEPGMRELVAAGERVRREAAEVMAERDRVLAQWNAARCANPFTAHGPRGEAAVARQVNAAAAARIRGIVLSHARTLGLRSAPAWLRDAWLPPAAPDPGFLDAPFQPVACVRATLAQR